MNIGAYLITTESQHSRCALIEKTWGSKMSNGDELYFFTDAKYNFNNYIKVTNNQTYFSHGIKQIESLFFAQKRSNIEWFLLKGEYFT